MFVPKKHENGLLLNFIRGFKEDCPDGRLHMRKVIEMYDLILPQGNAEVRAMTI